MASAARRPAGGTIARLASGLPAVARRLRSAPPREIVVLGKRLDARLGDKVDHPEVVRRAAPPGCGAARGPSRRGCRETG